MIVKAPKGSTFFPVDSELSPFMVAQIRKSLKQYEIMSYGEFDNFISNQSPIMGKVIKEAEIEYQSTPFYANVKDELLKQRLMRLGSPPMDTLIREAGVVLED